MCATASLARENARQTARCMDANFVMGCETLALNIFLINNI